MINKKKIFMSLLAVFLLLGLVACSSDEDETPNNDNVVVDEDDNDKDEEENEDVSDDMDEMIEEADYISKIKLITKGQDEKEIKVLENIKDPLSKEDLPELALEENRAYLVFLENEDGKVVLVDEEDSLVLLEGDNHELFEKINKHVHQ